MTHTRFLNKRVGNDEPTPSDQRDGRLLEILVILAYEVIRNFVGAERSNWSYRYLKSVHGRGIKVRTPDICSISKDNVDDKLIKILSFTEVKNWTSIQKDGRDQIVSLDNALKMADKMATASEIVQQIRPRCYTELGLLPYLHVGSYNLGRHTYITTHPSVDKGLEFREVKIPDKLHWDDPAEKKKKYLQTIVQGVLDYEKGWHGKPLFCVDLSRVTIDIRGKYDIRVMMETDHKTPDVMRVNLCDEEWWRAKELEVWQKITNQSSIPITEDRIDSMIDKIIKARIDRVNTQQRKARASPLHQKTSHTIRKR